MMDKDKGCCRFHCRTKWEIAEEAFLAGCDYAIGTEPPVEKWRMKQRKRAYKDWKERKCEK